MHNIGQFLTNRSVDVLQCCGGFGSDLLLVIRAYSRL